MLKLGVFKKYPPQHQILYQNPGQGYIAIFQILSRNHPVTVKYPHLLIPSPPFLLSPPFQLASETLAKYFQHFLDYIDLRAFLDENQNSLNQE